MSELTSVARAWWCRGGGAAVLALLTVVVVFRAPRDGIFWAAIGFFLAHTGMTLWRYLRDRRRRATATVLRHHEAQPMSAPGPVPALAFSPLPVTSLIALDIPPKMRSWQTKNTS